LISGSGDGWLYALQPRTGKIIWEYRLSRRGLNLAPTYDDGPQGHDEEKTHHSRRLAVSRPTARATCPRRTRFQTEESALSARC
jgi:hypothetical protein